jgi:MFS family permease
MPPSSRGRLITAPFVVVMVATFAFFTFVGMVVAMLPRFIEDDLGGNGLAIGLNLAVFSVAAIAARPLLGRVGDSLGRRALMIGGSILAGLAALCTSLVTSIYTLLPLRALSGVGEAALFVGAATLIADLSPANRRAEGASYFSLAVFGGLGIGPVIGELVHRGGSYHAVFVASSLCCLVAALDSIAAPNRVEGVATASPIEPRPLYNRAAMLPGLVLACGIAAFSAFNAFLPTYTESLGMGTSGPFVIYSVICLALRLVGARLPERLGLGGAVTSALTTLAAGLMVLALVNTVGGVYAGTVVLSIGMALMYPALMAFAVNSVREQDRSHALATFTMFFEVGTVVGGVVLGSVAQLTGERGAFAGGAALALAGIWILRTRLLPMAAGRPAGQPLVFDAGLAAGK